MTEGKLVNRVKRPVEEVIEHYQNKVEENNERFKTYPEPHKPHKPLDIELQDWIDAGKKKRKSKDIYADDDGNIIFE